jgi:hypothetical protein
MFKWEITISHGKFDTVHALAFLRRDQVCVRVRLAGRRGMSISDIFID